MYFLQPFFLLLLFFYFNKFVEKPINIPVQEDSSKDKDMLTLIKEYLKEKYNKKGNVYLGLVHRLDRPTGGVMVFARTSKAASRLSEQVRDKKMHKKWSKIEWYRTRNIWKILFHKRKY